MINSDLGLFLREVIRRPREVSAIVPSSKALARMMAAPLEAGNGPIIEFGPGTGKITEAILERGIAPQDLTLFEMNESFANQLRKRFQGTQVFTAAAQAAPQLHQQPAGAVVSGLPLLSMPEGLRREIVSAAFDVLRPDGFFVQFTYGAKLPIPKRMLDDLGLRARSHGPRVWNNLPPAQVYIFERAEH